MQLPGDKVRGSAMISAAYNKVRKRFSRDKRERGKSLVKYYFFKDSEYWYILASGLGIEKDWESDFADYYQNLKEISAKHWEALKLYGVLGGVGILSLSGAIAKFESFGIELSPEKYGAFFLPAVSLVACHLAMLGAKRAVL